jgi:hypothetical protein
MLVLAALRVFPRTIFAMVTALGAVAGCGGGNPLRVGDGGGGGQGGTAGHDGGITSSCHGLDEASCDVTPGCEAQHCQVCPGTPTFAGCTQPGEPVACPAEACVTAGPCTTLDANSCKARSDCTVLSCPDCMGGTTPIGTHTGYRARHNLGSGLHAPPSAPGTTTVTGVATMRGTGPGARPSPRRPPVSLPQH